nr:circumsporozoite protein-like [Setaria viridis]
MGQRVVAAAMGMVQGDVGGCGRDRAGDIGAGYGDGIGRGTDGKGDGAEAVGGGDRNGSGSCSGEDGGSGGGSETDPGWEEGGRWDVEMGMNPGPTADGVRAPAVGLDCRSRRRWMHQAAAVDASSGGGGCEEQRSASAKRHLLRLRRKKLGGRGCPGCAGAEAVALPAVFVDGKLLGGHDVGGAPGPSDSAILCCPQRQRPRRPTLRRTAESGGCGRRRAAAGDVAGA